MDILTHISKSLQRGKAEEVSLLVQKAIENGMTAQVILNEGLLAGMGILGGKFKRNEVYVPDVLIAARAMKVGTSILYRPDAASAAEAAFEALNIRL